MVEAVRNTVIKMDNILPLLTTPHYCRNNEDKVRWLAWKLGHTTVICPADKVRYIPEENCFELTVEE